MVSYSYHNEVLVSNRDASSTQQGFIDFPAFSNVKTPSGVASDGATDELTSRSDSKDQAIKEVD